MIELMDTVVDMTCKQCGKKVERVDPLTLPLPALPVQRVVHGDSPGHIHVQCPVCSPPWWCACVEIKLNAAGEA